MPKSKNNTPEAVTPTRESAFEVVGVNLDNRNISLAVVADGEPTSIVNKRSGVSQEAWIDGIDQLGTRVDEVLGSA